MVTNQLLHHPFIDRLKQVSVRTYLAIGLCLFVIWYILLFVVQREVSFTYASERSCIAQSTFLPFLQQATSTEQFVVTTENVVGVGSASLASSKTCITPVKTLESGRYSLAVAPFGGWLFRQNLVVSVPDAPTADVSPLKKAIPVTKALILRLSAPDVVHRYELLAGDKKATCNATGSSVTCDIASLGLEQGKEYDIKLRRQFAGSTEVVVAQKVQTLTATTVVDSTVKSGETVYARPQEFSFTTDKSLKHATIQVEKVGGDKVDIKTSVDGRRVVGTLTRELDREVDYVVTLTALEAEDGSSLVEPYTVPFRMSGGPKVISVNVGKAGVGTSASVVVTFDQELSSQQDISKIVTFSGGATAISRSGSQVVYQLQALPLCTSFTLTIAKGLMSKFDIPSNDAWMYTSRTVCHTTSVYGYSVQGRALVGYYLGSGGSTTLYVGAIHGNESSSSGLMKSWVDHLEANPALYEGKRVVVVPTINPDGVARGTRTNARGVNLNRNFPTANWVSDINDTDGQHIGGGGSVPLSEPEASALAVLTTNLRPRLLLSFHAVGSLVIGDPGGYSAGYASRYASMVGYRDATGQGGTFEYDITGAYEDWTYTKQNIPSIVVELGSYSYYNFAHHRAALEAMLQ